MTWADVRETWTDMDTASDDRADPQAVFDCRACKYRVLHTITEHDLLPRLTAQDLADELVQVQP